MACKILVLECEVWSVQCKVWSLKRKVRSVDCKVGSGLSSGECGVVCQMRSVECRV